MHAVAGEQGVQDDPPPECVPMGQVLAVKLQEAAPCVLKVPLVQGRQKSGESAPSAGEYVPAAHGVQVELSEAPMETL